MLIETGKGHVLAALATMAERNDIIRDTHGNVSQRVDENTFCIKPSGVPYKDIEFDDICVASINMPMNHNNKLNPSVDTVHHKNIYKKYQWVQSICHTHSPYAVAYAIREENISCRSTEHADYFGREIKCLPYSDLNSWGKEVILEEGERAILLGKHGVLTFGKYAAESVRLAVALENIAMKTFLAESGKSEMPYFPKKEIDKWHKRYINEYGQ